MRKFIGLLVLICAGWAGSVNAATAVMSGGQLMGATGVDVNGASYNVAFLEGSCNSLYNGCTGLPFTTGSEAAAASQALIDQVIQPQGIDIDNSYLINGIDLAYVPYYYSAAVIMTPAAELLAWRSLVFASSSLLSFGYTGLAVYVPSEQLSLFVSGPDESSSTSQFLVRGTAMVDDVFAVWTPAAVSAVPLPAAAWLFISAIAGLAGAKRLSRSKGSA